MGASYLNSNTGEGLCRVGRSVIGKAIIACPPNRPSIMATFALASELHKLSPAERSRVSHIICDDGEWSEDQIRAAIARALGVVEAFVSGEEDWTK